VHVANWFDSPIFFLGEGHSATTLTGPPKHGAENQGAPMGYVVIWRVRLFLLHMTQRLLVPFTTIVLGMLFLWTISWSSSMIVPRG
jgi:hypothetical protein